MFFSETTHDTDAQQLLFNQAKATNYILSKNTLFTNCKYKNTSFNICFAAYTENDLANSAFHPFGVNK